MVKLKELYRYKPKRFRCGIPLPSYVKRWKVEIIFLQVRTGGQDWFNISALVTKIELYVDLEAGRMVSHVPEIKII